MRRVFQFVLALALLLLSGCNRDIVPSEQESTYNTYKVAVMLPMGDEGYRQGFERISGWFQENFDRAQAGLSAKVGLELVTFDEPDDAPDSYFTGKAEEIAVDSSFVLFIGPSSSRHASLMAPAMYKASKQMITLSVTSGELMRAYAGKNFMWCLCESDITQCEVLLTKAFSYGARKISLIADDELYGGTFREWLPFQTLEMGMKTVGVYTADEAEKAFSDGSECVICAPENFTAVRSILEKYSRLDRDSAPRLLFSDVAFDAALPQLGEMAEMVEGVSPYADPASGFEIAYQTRYSGTPTAIEGQLYDALMIAGMALQFVESFPHGDTDVASLMYMAISSCLDKLDNQGDPCKHLLSWNYDGMATLLRAPIYYDVAGVTGELDYDMSSRIAPTQSIYCHWLLSGGSFVTLDFLSTSGTHRTSPATNSWEWHASVVQIYDEDMERLQYPELTDRWAVLVSASKGWYNYRHFSDVLDMYQLLRQNGYDDDHIILIASDDALNDPRNVWEGKIVNEEWGHNLYEEVVLDYHTDTLKAGDIYDILLGNSSDHLPVVLDSGAGSNVFFYWTGHGTFGNFLWKDADERISSSGLHDVLAQMSEKKRFRKMLFCAEPCYSGSVVSCVDGIDGVMGLCSSNGDESSFADNYSPNLGVWLCDRFTNIMVSSLRDDPSVSYRDLYVRLVNETIGSHVNIFNNRRFDNIYLSSPEEFIVNSNL